MPCYPGRISCRQNGVQTGLRLAYSGILSSTIQAIPILPREALIATDRLIATFDGPHIEKHGVPADCFARVLQGIQKAVRLMVEHLGGRGSGPGRPPQWARDQSALGLVASHPGSLVAELALTLPNGQSELLNLGPQAMEALLNWNQDEDISELPPQVHQRFLAISLALPEHTTLYLGTPADTRRVVLNPAGSTAVSKPEAEEALLQGWLKEVNWHNRTAQLHQSAGPYTRLQFGADLDEEMLRLATQYVEIRGHGTFRDDDNWQTVRVEAVNATRSWHEPFDLEEFLNDPNPKTFDPTEIVTLDLTNEEWETFNRAIRESREV